MTDQRTRTIQVECATAALLDDLRRHDWGQASPSVYETGQLVRLAPWLTGHQDRIDFLLATQRPTGDWGSGDSYMIVPTLSATAALLASGLPDHPLLVGAASRGLLAARRRLATAGPIIPDMPAIELIIPALVEEINALAEKVDLAPLRLPAGLDHRKLTWFRTLLAEGRPVPTKLWHALEVAGPASRRSPAVMPARNGSVGASPAATAAWLGAEEDGPSLGFLRAAAGRGPVPCATPITVFERAWVLGTLDRAGVAIPAVDDLADSLASALTGFGAATAPGLPPDADTTSMALYALERLGRPQDPRCLRRYRTTTHFCTWQGEEGVSTTVNAHVLEALGAAVPARAEDRPTMAALAHWLREQQRPDGSWVDRWHASPYYATAACALALHRYGGEASAAAVRRAADWALDTQFDDGSWGCRGGTAEETAYAMQLLVLTGAGDQRVVHSGHGFLVAAWAHLADPPALWHDKDLYAPTAIVRAAVIAAIHLAQKRLSQLSQECDTVHNGAGSCRGEAPG